MPENNNNPLNEFTNPFTSGGKMFPNKMNKSSEPVEAAKLEKEQTIQEILADYNYMETLIPINHKYWQMKYNQNVNK
jgi:hypothetical protein